MNHYRITDTITGQDLGIHMGDDGEDAMHSMALDHGFLDLTEALDCSPFADMELLAEQV